MLLESELIFAKFDVAPLSPTSAELVVMFDPTLKFRDDPLKTRQMPEFRDDPTCPGACCEKLTCPWLTIAPPLNVWSPDKVSIALVPPAGFSCTTIPAPPITPGYVPCVTVSVPPPSVTLPPVPPSDAIVSV